MIKKVIKRDGTVVEFNAQKIINALMAAGLSCREAYSLSHIIIDELGFDDKYEHEMTVEFIQHKVMKCLNEYSPDVGEAYTEYANQRTKQREKGSPLHKLVMGLVNRTDESILNENSNKDSRLIHTQRDLLAGLVCKHYGLNHILPKHIAKAHIDGVIHMHDLDYVPFFDQTNCCLVDLEFMLTNGFKMGNAEIETPNSIGTAAAITAQIVAQVASSQYGGTTIGDIDIVLAPYVRKTFIKHLENASEWLPNNNHKEYAQAMTERDVNSAMQALLYEVNTLHTSNGQSPFVTFGFGIGDTWEAGLIQEYILRNQMKGLGKKGITPVFPKLVYAVKKGHNAKEGDPFYYVKKLAIECSAKRMYPDFLSYENNLSITGSDKITYPMGCRAYLSAWQNEEGEYVTHGRNNLGAISLNLPRIAIESCGDFDKFWELLDQRTELIHEALDDRIKMFDGVKASIAPILYMEGAFGVKLKADDDISVLFKNGRASISMGYIGCHEMANFMFPDSDHTIDNHEKIEFITKVLEFMKAKVVAWKEQSGYGYTLYSTPSENLCDRFCRLDSEKFKLWELPPDVIDKGYYTNSFHLDVWKKVNPFEKFEFESKYHWIANGGHISYGEYPDMKGNLEALETCIDFAMENLDYVGTNTPVDKCFTCGFDGEFTATKEGYHCPKCGENDSAKISVIRRTCGYLGSVGSIPYIEGKQREVIGRVKHV